MPSLGLARPRYTRLMVISCGIAIALLSGCAAAPLQLPTPDAPIVVMAPHVADHLRDVQELFKVESAFCLGGAITDPFVVISWLKVAQTRFREPERVGYTECTDADFLGIAHNHPPGRGCMFSRGDSTTFMGSRRAVIDVVAGDARCILVRLRDGREVRLK